MRGEYYLAKLVILYTLYTPGASRAAARSPLAKPVTAEVLLLLSVGVGAGRLEEGVGGHLHKMNQ